MIKFIGLISLVTLVASLVTFITGFGLSTIMTTVLVFFIPLNVIIVLIAPIHWAHSLWRVVLYPTFINWRITLIFGLPAMLASYLGASLVHNASQGLFSNLVGILLICYSIVLWVKPSFRLNASNSMLVVMGFLTGFSAGIFGIRGAIRASALSAYDMKKESYIATTGMISIFVDTIRMFTYWLSGALEFLDVSLRIGILVFILVSFLGALAGRTIINHIPQYMFRVVVSVFIFLVGIKLLIWG